MFSKVNTAYLVLAALSATELALGRTLWLERNNRAVYLYPRRFGQEQPAVLQKLRDACPGQVCGNLAGQAVTPLLAAQPECSQQDMADAIIDASKQFDAATQENMIAIAQEYRQAEKNTPPDFTTNPPSLRNSVFCQKAPKNPELNGLVQAQDPANDPNLFFDPAKQATVKKGDQPNTFPFGGASSQPASVSEISSASGTAVPSTSSGAPSGTAVLVEQPSATPCVTVVTVTVTGTNPAATNTNAVTVSVGNAASATSTAAPTASATAPSSGADFGSCSVPEIEFGTGFDGRKETSFQPADKKSFNHGSAQNIAIISDFICDQLTNSCKANQAAKDLCATAESAAAAKTAGTGAQADAFNAVFGITTQFSNVASVDDQGKAINGTSTVSAATTSTAQLANTATATASSAPSSSADGGIGDFGSCSVPKIQFGPGFDGRKETSFEPVDKASYNHGSAQNIAIITKFMCDTLTNTCGADQNAKNTCATAENAAASAAAGTGAQADAFNAVFGITTDFASVTQLDDQGRPVGAASSSAASSPNTSVAVPPPAATTVESKVQSTSNPPPPASTGAPSNASGNRQTFTGSLGGVQPPAVTALGNGKFQVEGNSEFNDQGSAVERSCDVQNNLCANAANASRNQGGFTVAACNAQQAQCISAISS